jgi:hypothetical protein
MMVDRLLSILATFVVRRNLGRKSRPGDIAPRPWGRQVGPLDEALGFSPGHASSGAVRVNRWCQASVSRCERALNRSAAARA